MTKRIVTVLLVLCIIIGLVPALSACSPSKYDSLPDSYNVETDYPYMLCSNSNHSLFITKAEKGYYFLAGDFLYYMDSGTMTPVIVCNKPECKHEKETDPEKVWQCNAFIGCESGNPFIQYYEGNIYCTSSINNIGTNNMEVSGEWLVQINKDGTERKTICAIEDKDAFLALHRGYIYIYILDVIEQRYHLYRKSLQYPEKEAEELYTTPEDALYSSIYLFGNHIFIQSDRMSKDETELYSYVDDYNLQTDNYTAFLNKDNTDEHTYIFGIYDQKLLYKKIDIQKKNMWDKGEEILSYNLQNGSIETFMKLEQPKAPKYKRYLMSSGSKLLIYEQEMENYCPSAIYQLSNDGKKIIDELDDMSIYSKCYDYNFIVGDDNYAFEYYTMDGYTFELDIVDKNKGLDIKNIFKENIDVLKPEIAFYIEP